MIQDQTVKKLMQISVPKTFKAQECICYEGQPGSEMYIILRGMVGVYVCNPVGAQIEVARFSAGAFFGEMAAFDNVHRSATCIALDDVVCVAIDKNRLTALFSACPELTLKMFESMSGRIRTLDSKLYKTETGVQDKKICDFAIPDSYCGGRDVKEPALPVQSAARILPCLTLISAV